MRRDGRTGLAKLIVAYRYVSKEPKKDRIMQVFQVFTVRLLEYRYYGPRAASYNGFMPTFRRNTLSPSSRGLDCYKNVKIKQFNHRIYEPH